MLKKFYPHGYADSVFAIDYGKLYQKGYRAIIFDIDNTLVPHGYPSNDKVDAFIAGVQKIGFKTFMLSDNYEQRVLEFLTNIDSMYINDAKKPDPASFLKAVEMLGVRKEEVIVIGDQIFKDILGANNSGLDSILVKFIRLKSEKKIGKRRRAEQVILWFYTQNSSCFNRLGDVCLKESEEYAEE